MRNIQPIVGEHYQTSLTTTAEVIAIGTRGVVLEFPDGQVQLIKIDDWQAMQYQPLDTQAQQQLA